MKLKDLLSWYSFRYWNGYYIGPLSNDVMLIVYDCLNNNVKHNIDVTFLKLNGELGLNDRL